MTDVATEHAATPRPTTPRSKSTAKRRAHLVTGQALREDDDAVLGHPGAHATHAIEAPVVSTGHALRSE